MRLSRTVSALVVVMSAVWSVRGSGVVFKKVTFGDEGPKSKDPGQGVTFKLGQKGFDRHHPQHLHPGYQPLHHVHPTTTTTTTTTQPPTYHPHHGHGHGHGHHQQHHGHGHGLKHCSCMPTSYCHPPPDGSGQIDIRIVTVPVDPPTTCITGQVYCCHHNDTTLHTCGTRTIINVPGITPQPGQAPFGAYPWSALILGLANDYVGGGVLIDTYHILTAAHKVVSYSNGVGLKVRLGEWNAGNDTEPYPYMEYSVTALYVHPNFDANNLHNDLAVMRLTSEVPVTTTPNINTVCLPGSGTNFAGRTCWVSGWGKDAFGPNGSYQEIQKAVDVIIHDHTTCQDRLRSTRLGPHFVFDPSFLCAGGEASKDACTGDGGSPLVCEIDGAFYIAGMVAWGIGCADVNVPGVYVNIEVFHSWLLRHLQ